ncbi:hypothetical protein OG21DRAFT_1522358 [Imleria badia]|nr:hypothetical protein OG21DRAFT_1522358 [Imleria badia]
MSDQDATDSDRTLDHDNSDSDLILPIPEHGATTAEYQQCVKELQLLVRKYHDQIQTLKDKNAELSVNQHKRALKNVPKELTVNDDRISLLGRKYGVMVELMVLPQSFFQKPCPSPALRFDDKDRYRTKATAEAALIAELHSFIADQDLIQMMKSAHFHATFEKAAYATRSSILNTLRDVIGATIGSQYERSDKPHEYMFLFPALYTNLEVKGQNLFGNWQVLAKILKVALFRQKFLRARVQRGGPKTNGQLWGVSILTPGAITWAIIILLFLLSSDTSFPKNGVGSISKIPYKDWFSHYKDILIQRWMSQRIEHIVKLMNHYASSDRATGDLVAAIDTALAQLDLGFDDDSDVNDLYSDQPLAAAADLTEGPSLADELVNNELAGVEPAVVPAAAAIDQELAVNDPLSVLTVDSEMGSASRAKKGRSKKGKTHNGTVAAARRSARTQGDK